MDYAALYFRRFLKILKTSTIIHPIDIERTKFKKFVSPRIRTILVYEAVYPYIFAIFLFICRLQVIFVLVRNGYINVKGLNKSIPLIIPWYPQKMTKLDDFSKFRQPWKRADPLYRWRHKSLAVFRKADHFRCSGRTGSILSDFGLKTFIAKYSTSLLVSS